MITDHQAHLDRHLERFSQLLPRWAGQPLDWLWQPHARWVRNPIGVMLVFGGMAGFLPILGFWMLPLGLLFLARDIRPLQPTLVRVLNWAERKWPPKEPLK